MGLGTWKEEEIEILTRMVRSPWEMRLPSMAIHILMWTRRVARSGMWERLAKALNIFQKKPYISQ